MTSINQSSDLSRVFFGKPFLLGDLGTAVTPPVGPGQNPGGVSGEKLSEALMI